jgi:beta-lactamase class A
MLTTNAVARLIHSIAGGVAVSAERSQAMLALMQRQLDLPAPHPHEDENQIHGFFGEGLPAGTRLYSKAGFTSKVRHDAAYVEIPDGHPFVLAVFTEGQEHSHNKILLPTVAKLVTEFVRRSS